MEAVAPHAGSVDRNSNRNSDWFWRRLSLPTRGAWIEISISAERAISVGGSLPTRGAWIEIYHPLFHAKHLIVAPHAGSVDRNQFTMIEALNPTGRSPRGERG